MFCVECRVIPSYDDYEVVNQKRIRDTRVLEKYFLFSIADISGIFTRVLASFMRKV